MLGRKFVVFLMVLMFLVAVIPIRHASCDIGLVVTYPHAFYFIVPPGSIINGSDLYVKFRNTGSENLLINVTVDEKPDGIEVNFPVGQFKLKAGSEYILRFWLNISNEVVPATYSFKSSTSPVATVTPEGDISAITFPAYAVPIKVEVAGISHLIVIRAVDPGGTVVRDATVRLFLLVDDSWNQISEQKGVLSKRVVPGTYRIIVMYGGKIRYDETIEINNDTTLDVVLRLLYFQDVEAGLVEGKIVVRFYLVNEFKKLENVVVVYERNVEGEPYDSGLIATMGDLPIGMYGPYTLSLEPKYGRNTIKLKAIVGTLIFCEATAEVNVPKPRSATWLDILTIIAIIVLVPSGIWLVVKKRNKIRRGLSRLFKGGKQRR